MESNCKYLLGCLPQFEDMVPYYTPEISEKWSFYLTCGTTGGGHTGPGPGEPSGNGEEHNITDHTADLPGTDDELEFLFSG